MSTTPQVSLTEHALRQPQLTDADVAVVFRGDGEPQTAQALIRRLQAFDDAVGIAPDSFARGGTVARLEQRCAEMLGKEAAVFMPTGTLANHLAIRQLCGVQPRAVVPEQSHLYNDTGDCVPRLSGINLMPLAPGRPAFTLAELQGVLQGSVTGRVVSAVGAVMIESPVRRQHGQIMPYEDMLKYFGAPFGAILAGTQACLAGLYHERRMFGGGLASASLAAALALRGIEGFAERFGTAMAKGATLIDCLNTCEGIKIRRFPHGSNIFPVELDPHIDVEIFLATLRQHGIFLCPDEGSAGHIHLTVNTTILRQPNEAIMEAFEHAIRAGWKRT